MKIVQLVKQLNNTELGKGGTHDTYMLIPNDVDITDLFPNPNVNVKFIYKKNGDEVLIRHTVGREKRIVGLGPFYSKHDVCAGDEVVLERRIVGEQITHLIDLRKKKNIVVFQRLKNGFEVLTPERLGMLSGELHTEESGLIEVIYLDEQKKRADSPDYTQIYDLKVNGNSIVNDYAAKEIIELEVRDKVVKIKRFCTWRKYIIEARDDNE